MDCSFQIFNDFGKSPLLNKGENLLCILFLLISDNYRSHTSHVNFLNYFPYTMITHFGSKELSRFLCLLGIIEEGRSLILSYLNKLKLVNK
jgi:hypothetical protein